MISNHFLLDPVRYDQETKSVLSLGQTLNCKNTKIPRPFGSWAFIWLGEFYVYPRTCPHAGDLMEQTLAALKLPHPLHYKWGALEMDTPPIPWRDTLQICVSPFLGRLDVRLQCGGRHLFGCWSLATRIWFGHRCYSWCRCGRLLRSGSVCSRVIRS